MEKKKKDWGVSRQAEERYLGKTLAVVNDNLESYGREVARMQEDIDEMLAHYHDDNVEVLTILNNTVTMHEHMKRALMRNEKAQNKPYFGRIIFHDETLNKEESLYIGKGGISKDTTHWMVVDWRAPVANAYYENGLGKCSYEAPGGVQVRIDLRLKRTYEIEGGRLLDYFDSEVIANDELLTKYLAKNKEAVLGEIVATIQKEQNEIIRKSPYHNTIVQGVAGSGKTTVAMHRISYILYNYEERFRPDDFYIVGSNRILLNYITGVLPDLDVYGVRQMTMEQLFVRLLYEDWDEKKYGIRSVDQSGKRGKVKGGSQWFRDLEKYCVDLERQMISTKSVFLDPKQFVEGFRNGKTGVFDETGGKSDPRRLVCLLEGEAVERYLRENPAVSIQSKIDMLNERLMGKVKDEFLGKGVRYTEAERKAITKAYRGRYGKKIWKRPIFDLYREFLAGQAAKGMAVDIPDLEFDVYDLAALAYLYKRVKEQEVISEAHHVVIDEAQDFGMMAYRCLKFCIGGCTYTIMGDVSQNIHFGFGLNDWEELRELLLPDPMDSFGILKKSYRNTVEISDFATGILHHGQFSSYPVEPIIRHGNPVRVRKLSDPKELIREAADVCRSFQGKGLDTIAVVCRDRREAAQVSEELSKYVDVGESDLEKAVFGAGIMVLPVEYTKGLEFDAVLILNPTREGYPSDDGHAKLLYVAATRALHELVVLYLGNLTGLIADPLPERRQAGKDGKTLRTGPAGKENAGTVTGTEKSLSADGVLSEKRVSSPGSGGSAGRKRPVAAALPDSGAAAGRAATPDDKKPFLARYLSGARANTAGTLTAGTGSKGAEPGRAETKAAEASEMKSAESKRAEERRKDGAQRPGFGDMPATGILRPAGHGKIDLSVRWVMKQKDGLYLQSRYGTLRLCPLGSAIVRITFERSGQIADVTHPEIRIRRTDPMWMYREASGIVELTTDELCLQVEKRSGAIRYMTRDKRLLLAERRQESRQIETGTDGRKRQWLFLEFAKDEKVYGIGEAEKQDISLRGTARYISHADAGKMPLMFSDKGYGILAASKEQVICCDLPAYGTWIGAEGGEQLDYYFIAGKRRETIVNACGYLCGYR